MNPLLDLNEYVPDVEPHIFNDRLYIYGSHDAFNGKGYCEKDYVLYSADLNDLNHFKNEGYIYHKYQDEDNKHGSYNMFAPDVVQGNDGRYYLYYGLSGVDKISIAVSDKCTGPFEYYGHVEYPEGIAKETLSDYPANFDPGLINDDGHIYLSLGFSIDPLIPAMGLTRKNTKGAYVVELEDDMKTMKHVPVKVIPGVYDEKGSSFEGHAFLEASSLRKYDDVYYFIYSSQNQHELCYAISDSIYGPYTYGGILISNAGKMKEDDPYLNNWANNHGSLIKIKKNYYIFYHRHTNATQYSRQLCAEKIIKEGVHFNQALMTSSGFEDLECGRYDAAIACFVYEGEGQFLGFDSISKPVTRMSENVIKDVKKSTIMYRFFKEANKIRLIFEKPVSGMVSLKINEAELSETVSNEKTVTFDYHAQHASLTFDFDLTEKQTLVSIEVL